MRFVNRILRFVFNFVFNFLNGFLNKQEAVEVSVTLQLKSKKFREKKNFTVGENNKKKNR